MLGALRTQGATVGVEVFGDCPLIDPAIVDQMIGLYLDAAAQEGTSQGEAGACDFVGNDLTTTWPPGMEVEVFSMAAFEDSDRRCRDPAIREHGTLFIRQNPGLYRLKNIEAPPAFHRPELELEVDTLEDVAVLEAVFNHFSGTPDFGLAALIAFLDADPTLAALNQNVPRRWKEFRADG